MHSADEGVGLPQGNYLTQIGQPLMAEIRSRLLATIAAGVLLTSALVASPASAADDSDGSSLSLPGALVLERAEQGSDVTLPDGSALRFPADVDITKSRASIQVEYPDGLRVGIPESTTRTPGGYYPAVVTTYSRSQTETVYKAVSNIDNVCRFVPLPYLAGIGCSASPTVRNAFNQAHYQKKRVQQLFYRSKTCSSCSRTDYKVIK